MTESIKSLANRLYSTVTLGTAPNLTEERNDQHDASLNLAISEEEEIHLANGELREFWLSRLKKRDPVARIGCGIWANTDQEYKEAIESGDPEYWNHKGYNYWNSLVLTTIANITAGIVDSGFPANSQKMRTKIKEVGISVAKLHARFVKIDIENNIGDVPGLLSTKQLADYHHIAFAEHKIARHFYGGTWLRSIPDPLEFIVTGRLYCHDCDTTTGYVPGVHW